MMMEGPYTKWTITKDRQELVADCCGERMPYSLLMLHMVTQSPNPHKCVKDE